MQAYGIVWKAIDKKTRETVALKKIFDAFQNATDAQVIVCRCPANDISWSVLWRGCCGGAALNDGLLVQRTFREIMFLQELNNHENIIRSVPTTPVRCLIRLRPCPIPL